MHTILFVRRKQKKEESNNESNRTSYYGQLLLSISFAAFRDIKSLRYTSRSRAKFATE